MKFYNSSLRMISYMFVPTFEAMNLVASVLGPENHVENLV